MNRVLCVSVFFVLQTDGMLFIVLGVYRSRDVHFSCSPANHTVEGQTDWSLITYKNLFFNWRFFLCMCFFFFSEIERNRKKETRSYFWISLCERQGLQTKQHKIQPKLITITFETKIAPISFLSGQAKRNVLQDVLLPLLRIDTNKLFTEIPIVGTSPMTNRKVRKLRHSFQSDGMHWAKIEQWAR